MRIDVTDWTDVIEQTAHSGLRLNLHTESGVVDATVDGYFVPDGDIYDIRPDLTQHHPSVEEIFVDWEQVATQSHWQTAKPYWFIFTHPMKGLPCIVEFHVHP